MTESLTRTNLNGNAARLESADASSTVALSWRDGIALYFEWNDATEEARLEIEARYWRKALTAASEIVEAHRQAGDRKSFWKA